MANMMHNKLVVTGESAELKRLSDFTGTALDFNQIVPMP